MLNFIVDTDSDTGATLYIDYTTSATRDARDLVRNDQTMAFSVEPVTLASDGSSTVFDADYEATDTFIVKIGPIDEAPTGGTFALDVGGTSTDLTALAYNITAAALQTPLSAAFVTEGESACTVTLINEGVYQIDATTNGAITTGILTGTATGLSPACDIAITEVSLGSASTKYQLILTIRQAAIASATPATALTTAGVTVTTTQAQSATANKIQKAALDAARTYGGTFSVSATVNGVTQTCGVATPLMSASEFGVVLAGHPNIKYQETDGTADNISVTKSGQNFFVEFTGTQGAATLKRTITDATVANPTELTFDANHNWVTGQSVTITGSSGTTPTLDGTHTITVTAVNKVTIPVNVTAATAETGTAINTTQPAITATNIDLIAPQGRSGTISLNTFNLLKLSLAQDADEFTLPMQIQRTRASGEVRKIWLGEVTLKKEIIDTSTMVNLPSLFTDNNTWTGIQTFQGGIQGTATNDSAAAGHHGQIISSFITSGSAVSLTTATTANVTSISLTAGDWDVEGNVNYNLTSATATAFSAGISATSATVPADGSEASSGVITTTATAVNGIALVRKRASLASTTTIYLVARSTFSAGTIAAFGGITARRVR